MRTISIILAAGQGKRLLPRTLDTPKCLVNVGGLPILCRQLSALEKNGLEQITIVTGFMAYVVERYATSNFPNLHFTFIRNPRFSETNTLYSLALAAETVPAGAGVLQLNGDVVFDPAIIARLLDTDPDASYAAVHYKPCGTEEIKAVCASDNSIALLNKSVAANKAVGEAVGINKFSPKFWQALARHLERLKEPRADEYFEYALERAIAQGEKIYPFDIGTSRVIEIDFPRDLEEAERSFLAGY